MHYVNRATVTWELMKLCNDLLSCFMCMETCNHELEKFKQVIVSTVVSFLVRCYACIIAFGSQRTEDLSRIIKTKASFALGPYSLSGNHVKAARSDATMIVLLLNLTDISTALLAMRILNFGAIVKVLIRISRLRDFPRSCGKTPSHFTSNKSFDLLLLEHSRHNSTIVFFRTSTLTYVRKYVFYVEVAAAA